MFFTRDEPYTTLWAVSECVRPPAESATSPSQIFHDVAYKAKDRSDLVAGIDEFLDQVTVLPPGEWDPSIRIEPPKNVPSQVNDHKLPKGIVGQHAVKVCKEPLRSCSDLLEKHSQW